MRAIQAILARNLIKFFRDKMRFFFTLFMGGFLLFTFSFVIMKTVAGKCRGVVCHLFLGMEPEIAVGGTVNDGREWSGGLAHGSEESGGPPIVEPTRDAIKEWRRVH
jgi:hypothetical protein